MLKLWGLSWLHDPKQSLRVLRGLPSYHINQGETCKRLISKA